ncbi:YkuS family protein [Anaerophilus nitritogenes]|uniref:YkuS family protein n=1 Tax=Anaerophilus nitritogenes TaxID=2498136 RepID=UPI0013E9C7B5|nr:YkuS family protein [Anaerophilus nitritogenes]
MKTIGVQQELNEIAEELVRQGFDVRNLSSINNKVDAIVYYDDKSIRDNPNKDKIIKINAAKINIDQIVRKLKDI